VRSFHVKYARAVSSMVKKARAAGSFLGGIANNPGVIILGLVLGGLIIFRNQISSAVSSIPGAVAGGIGDISIGFPDIKFPDIKFPDFKFPDFKFPDFKFPDIVLPEFLPNQQSIPELAEDAPVQTEGPLKGFEGSPEGPKLPADKNLFQTVILDPFLDFLTPAQKFAAEKGGAPSSIFGILDFLGISFASAEEQQGPQLPTSVTPNFFGDTVLNLTGDPSREFEGGGPSFMGGEVNPTPITTLTQVLNLFPNLTSSQAADFLGEFRGILPEAALLQGGDIINISQFDEDPLQMFNQTSIPNLSGDPNEIFRFLFPNVISNF